MHPFLQPLSRTFVPTGDLQQDVTAFLSANGCPNTARHSIAVGEQARKLALQFGFDPDQAAAAGYLHDISAVFPNAERIEAAEALQIDLLDEELIFPMIIHQKLSKPMARDLFNIHDAKVLQAVECHTTLRAHSSKLDRILFVADKIAWDQEGTPPYIDDLMSGLEQSLEHAALAYLKFLWDRKEQLKVLHPWAEAGYKELASCCASQ
ncbi:HD domain-containing protein [Paenibacillus senegalensis]|uniref:HD domain-containing protein n=1 Tax=Paenibacillus senegalensis TaxID=1465766 RepID=UPI00028860CC|nr:HD domain-containing protein [Paenibacillus senegalensis]